MNTSDLQYRNIAQSILHAITPRHDVSDFRRPLWIYSTRASLPPTPMLHSFACDSTRPASMDLHATRLRQASCPWPCSMDFAMAMKYFSSQSPLMMRRVRSSKGGSMIMAPFLCIVNHPTSITFCCHDLDWTIFFSPLGIRIFLPRS